MKTIIRKVNFQILFFEEVCNFARYFFPIGGL